MDTKFIDVLDGKCTELNNRPSLHLERVFSLVRRLEEHLKTNRLSESLVAQLVGELACYVVLIPVIMPLREKSSLPAPFAMRRQLESPTRWCRVFHTFRQGAPLRQILGGSTNRVCLCSMLAKMTVQIVLERCCRK